MKTPVKLTDFNLKTISEHDMIVLAQQYNLIEPGAGEDGYEAYEATSAASIEPAAGPLIWQNNGAYGAFLSLIALMTIVIFAVKMKKS